MKRNFLSDNSPKISIKSVKFKEGEEKSVEIDLIFVNSTKHNILVFLEDIDPEFAQSLNLLEVI